MVFKKKTIEVEEDEEEVEEEELEEGEIEEPDESELPKTPAPKLKPKIAKVSKEEVMVMIEAHVIRTAELLKYYATLTK